MGLRLECALHDVLQELKSMKPDELKAELDKNRNGDVARLLREIRAFTESGGVNNG